VAQAVIALIVVLTAIPGRPALAAAAASGPAESTGGRRDKDVVLLGDSLTALAFGYLGGPTSDAPERLLPFFAAGWTLRDAVATAGPAVDAPSTGVVVLAVGANDAAPWDGGWTSEDVAHWAEVLDDVPSSTCVAVVLPGWGPQLDGTPWAQGMEQMRTDARRLVAARRSTGARTFTVDWRPVVERHPDYIAPDGIHIAGTEAATALQGLYWHAVARCRHHPTG
jgi:hypothetical protein